MIARTLVCAALLALALPGARGWVSPLTLIGPITHADGLPLRSPLLRRTLLDAPSILREADRSLATIDQLFDQMIPDGDDIMGLMRPTLRSPLNELAEELGGGQMQLSTPAFEFKELDDGILVTAATPGLSKNDLSVEVVKKDRHGNYLVVTGHSKKEEGAPANKDKADKDQKKKEGESDKPTAFRRSEYRFERSFRLPDNVDPDSITSKYQDGMLQVHMKSATKALPKPEERKKIAIA